MTMRDAAACAVQRASVRCSTDMVVLAFPLHPPRDEFPHWVPTPSHWFWREVAGDRGAPEIAKSRVIWI